MNIEKKKRAHRHDLSHHNIPKLLHHYYHTSIMRSMWWDVSWLCTNILLWNVRGSFFPESGKNICDTCVLVTRVMKGPSHIHLDLKADNNKAHRVTAVPYYVYYSPPPFFGEKHRGGGLATPSIDRGDNEKLGIIIIYRPEAPRQQFFCGHTNKTRGGYVFLYKRV